MESIEIAFEGYLPMQIKGFVHSVVGTREMNQDSFLVAADRGLFAVADGVGGGLRGEVASRMAVEGIAKYSSGPHTLRKAVERIQAEILHEALSSIGEALMGTTFTSLQIVEDEATICHVGDSRCYLYAESCLRQISRDHEAFDEILQSSVLCSYLGIPSDVHPLTIQEETFAVAPGNRLLLCSDGLYRQMTETRMVALLREYASEPQALVELLCSEAATSSDSSDNVTVVYVELD